MNIIKNLYIAPTNQIARSLKETLIKENPFVIVKTLESIIHEILNNYTSFLDKDIATNLIHKIIHDNSIEHFSYMSINSESLGYIYDLIVKSKRNSIKFKTIIKATDKLDALVKIKTEYENFKSDNNLYDLADLEKSVYDSLFMGKFEYFNNFDEVFIYDKFLMGKTNFFSSKYQEMIFDILKNKFNIHKEKNNTLINKAKLIKPKNEVFDNVDEVKTAFKIVRKLMETGISDKDIIIVTTDMEEYAPIFRLFLDEYNLKGYDSIGTALISYKGKYYSSGESVLSSYNKYLQKVETIKQKLKSININFDEEYLKLSLLKNQFVLSDKLGIELTEPNQLIGSLKPYKHVIFIGADIEHFPPKAEDNFLYTIKDSIKYFYTNSYYYSSELQLDELKRISENLYIINANYKSGKKLAPSILIPEDFDSEIDISDIKSVNDITKLKQITKPNESLDKYIKSINDNVFTSFDGIGVENIELDHLSASQLNKFSACPLSYLYMYNLKIKAPKKINSGFDHMDIGTLMHKIFEVFTKEVKSGKAPSYDLMKSVLNSVQNEESKKLINKKNVLHDIIFEDFKKGLDNKDLDLEEKGVLAKFTDYIQDNITEFEGLKNSEFEKKFYLDKNFKITDDEESYFIKGFIDRVDNLNEYANIIDYKSKTKPSSAKEMNRVTEFKEFQLSLYTLYAKQFYKKDIVASFLTFREKSKKHTEFGTIKTNIDNDIEYYKSGKQKGEAKPLKLVHFDDDFEQNLKNKILEIKDNIENGKFYFNNEDEETCKYCDMKNLCHQALLVKEL